MPTSTVSIRPPVVAGRFYPAEPPALLDQVASLVEAAQTAALAGPVVALVAPHAGYTYSGPTAAAAFKQASGLSFDTVFVVGPSHFDAFRGVTVYPGAAYSTPLGTVPVDLARRQALIDFAPGLIRAREAGHREEHGIEVELPFLQHALSPGWKLVPLVMGSRSASECVLLAEAIGAASENAPTLIVASSDLYHGYDYDECHATDRQTLQGVEQLDPSAFVRGLESDVFQACGGGPIAVAQHIARGIGNCRASVLAHTTSADITGRHTGYVVGYGAAVICRTTEV